jgi:hypothetical protein
MVLANWRAKLDLCDRQGDRGPVIREELTRLFTWQERHRRLDVALEMWAIFVVTAVAGSFASFFTSGDSS